MRKLAQGVALLAVLAAPISHSFITAATAAPAKSAKSHKKVKKQTLYTCKMHPEVISHKPGKCPKCKMPLTKK